MRFARLPLAMPRAAQVLASTTAGALPWRQVARFGMTASRRQWTQVIAVFACGGVSGKIIACAIHAGHLMASGRRACRVRNHAPVSLTEIPGSVPSVADRDQLKTRSGSLVTV